MIGNWVKCRVTTLEGGWWEMKFVARRLWIIPVLRAECRVRSSDEAWKEALDCLYTAFPEMKRPPWQT